jgi:hypothetical protein
LTLCQKARLKRGGRQQVGWFHNCRVVPYTEPTSQLIKYIPSGPTPIIKDTMSVRK